MSPDAPAPPTDAETAPTLPLDGFDIFVAVPHSDDRSRVTWMLGKAGASACAIKSWPQRSQRGDLVDKLVGRQDLALLALDPQPMVALAFASWLRDHGFEKPIVGLAAADPRIDASLLRRAGCDEVLRFPKNAKELVVGLLPHLGLVESPCGLRPLAAHAREPSFLFELTEEFERHFCGGCSLAEICAPGQLPADEGCPAAKLLRNVFAKVADKGRVKSREAATV